MLLIAIFHNHALSLGFQFKCSWRFGVRPLCTQWPVSAVCDLGFCDLDVCDLGVLTWVIVTWLTFVGRLTYHRLFMALCANLGLLNGSPLPYGHRQDMGLFVCFRHTSDVFGRGILWLMNSWFGNRLCLYWVFIVNVHTYLFKTVHISIDRTQYWCFISDKRTSPNDKITGAIITLTLA